MRCSTNARRAPSPAPFSPRRFGPLSSLRFRSLPPPSMLVTLSRRAAAATTAAVVARSASTALPTSILRRSAYSHHRRPLHRWVGALNTQQNAGAAAASAGCGKAGCGCASSGAVPSGDGSSQQSSTGDGSTGGGCGSGGSCACATAKQAREATAAAASAPPLSAEDQALKESELAHLQSEVSRLYSAGEFEQALAACVRSVELSLALFGDEHPSYASTLNNAALLHKVHRQDYDAAAQLYERALHAYAASVGERHTSYLTAASNLALVRKKQGRLDEAEQLLTEVVAAHREAAQKAKDGLGRPGGASDPNAIAAAAGLTLPLASSLLSLGGVLCDRGSFDRAVALQKESLALLKRRYGLEHPATATALNNLAYTLKSSGDLATAQTLYESALAIRSSNLPPTHPDIVVSMNNLAEVLRAQGKEEQALKVQEKIIQRVQAQQEEQERLEAEEKQAQQEQQQQANDHTNGSTTWQPRAAAATAESSTSEASR